MKGGLKKGVSWLMASIMVFSAYMRTWQGTHFQTPSPWNQNAKEAASCVMQNHACEEKSQSNPTLLACSRISCH